MKAQSNANDAGIVEKMATALVTGGLASALSKTAVAPFERIRLLLQTQTLIPGHSNEYKGVVDAFMRLPREQGVLSMWRGNIPNLLRIVPTYALRFSLFDYFQDLASIGWQQGKPLSLTRQMASGALSGFATVLVTYPLDLARTRMSAELTRASLVSPLDARPSSLMETLRVVVQHEGFFGLYRGLFISSLEITPYLAISLGGYEYLKASIPPERDSTALKLGLAWFSGFVASLTCFPIDTLKRRIMLDGSPGFESSSAAACLESSSKGRLLRGLTGTLAYAQEMHAQGGVRVFYRGCMINALKSAPAAALTFVVNDVLKDAVSTFKARSITR